MLARPASRARCVSRRDQPALTRSSSSSSPGSNLVGLALLRSLHDSCAGGGAVVRLRATAWCCGDRGIPRSAPARHAAPDAAERPASARRAGGGRFRLRSEPDHWSSGSQLVPHSRRTPCSCVAAAGRAEVLHLVPRAPAAVERVETRRRARCRSFAREVGPGGPRRTIIRPVGRGDGYARVRAEPAGPQPLGWSSLLTHGYPPGLVRSEQTVLPRRRSARRLLRRRTGVVVSAPERR